MTKLFDNDIPEAIQLGHLTRAEADELIDALASKEGWVMFFMLSQEPITGYRDILRLWHEEAKRNGTTTKGDTPEEDTQTTS